MTPFLLQKMQGLIFSEIVDSWFVGAPNGCENSERSKKDHKTTPCTSDDLELCHHYVIRIQLYLSTRLYIPNKKVLDYTVSTTHLEKMNSKFLVFQEFP